MRKSLGCVLSAAVLAGSLGASLPAWANEANGSELGEYTSSNMAVSAESLKREALEPTVEFPFSQAKQAHRYAAAPTSEQNAASIAQDVSRSVTPETVKAEAEHVAAEAPKADAPAPAPAEKNSTSSDAQAEPATASTPSEVKSDAPAAPAQGSESAPASDSATPAVKAEAADNDPAVTPAKKVEQMLIFGGTVESVSEQALRLKGTGSDGQPLSLDFIVDSSSQVAEGIKNGDQVVVYYEIVQSGGYRVSSARYVSGELPKNVFPADVPEKFLEQDKAKAELDKANEAAPVNEADLPHVVGIEVEGCKAVPAADVLQVLSTRIGDPLLDPRIRRDLQAIYDMGFFTDVRLDSRFAPGGVRLVFRVLENPVVNEIKMSGNNIAETTKLRELMGTKEGEILNTRVLQSDLQAINKYYNEDLGYTISPSHVTKLDFTNGVLTLNIIDGIEVKGVKVTGVTVYPPEKVEALVTTKPGDLFNRNRLREDTEAISALYDKDEYILDTIKPSIDVETGVVTIQVVEAVLQEIKLVGNTRTKDDTILRNIRSKPGEVMRRDRVQRDLERLNNLGYFKKVEPEVEPGSAPGQAILVLNIEEQKTGLATVGVGYAGGGSGAVRPGITGAVSFSERNLFGEGKQASINLQRGSQIGSYGISYYDPAINSAQDSIGVSLYYNSVDDLEQSVTGAEYGTYAYYDQKVYGITVTYGHPFTDDLRGFVTLRHETIDSKMSGKSLYVPVGIGKGDLNAIGLSALYDTRDDVFNPHKGEYFNAYFTYAGSFLGGDYDYTKIVAEGRYYWPVTERSTLALRGMYGSVGNGAPASEYFYAGGTDTMRGYEDNAFFGTKTVLLNAEYRFPIANIKMLSGAVFVDAGNAWITGYSDSRLYTDAGVGLRIVFPNLGLGVIRIDYAFGQDGSRASIGIGQSF